MIFCSNFYLKGHSKFGMLMTQFIGSEQLEYVFLINSADLTVRLAENGNDITTNERHLRL